MKKILLILIFFCFQFINSQNVATKSISISFENETKINVIKKIENLTNYRFYFVESWLDDELISGQFNNSSLQNLLDSVFKNTIINYFITSDNKVILSRSILINGTLPEWFSNESDKTISQTEAIEPVFFNEEAPIPDTAIETVRIGKENKFSRKKYYTLTGFAKNNTTNEPIPNLAIIVKNKNINTVTDINGYYFINLPPGINIIETKSIGIQDSSKKVIIYDNGTLNLSLQESAEILKEVTIEANRDRNIKEAITGNTQIKIETIKSVPLVLGERDILKVAITLPGISNAGEGASGYNVRGGKEDQNLILLDNGVVYNPSHFFGIFSALNPFTIKDVNIYKGTIPAEYGGRLSSVFDINTKNSNTEKFSGEVSFGPVTSNVALEIPIIKGTSGLLVGARGAYSDWILKSLDEKSLKNSTASFYDAVLKYQHKINENNNLEATGYYSDDSFSISSDSLYGYNNQLMSLKWNHKFNTNNHGDLSLVNSKYKFNITYDGNSDNNFELGYNVNETELKLKMKYLLNEQHSFDYGISSKLYVVNPGNKDPKGSESIVEPFKIPKEKALESAIFISDNYNVNKNLLFNLGFRYSIYSSIGEATQKLYKSGFPKSEGTVTDTLTFGKNEVIKTYGGPEIRASLRYFLFNDFSIKASYNSTYQYIHTLSNNTTASSTDIWKLSDLNIKPQQANQYTLGLYKNIDGNTYELSLEGYYKKSKNIIDYKVGADLLLNKSIETEVLQGDGKAYGIEFLIKKTKGKFNGWFGYNYSRSFNKFNSIFSEERINNGDFFPSNFDKPHDISIVANYKLTKRFSFSANFAYQTGRPITYPVGNYNFNGIDYVLYSDRNKLRIPDYYRLDLGFNIEGNHKIKKFAHSFWNISIYNALGRNNPYSVFFVTEKGKVKAYQSSIFSIPIPTITYNFKF
ncbi:carboxypeptidase-like regulatory domain-containing protein [uncultured Lutibacter sp.]|uniref:TonB-dependent receptor n=1 Tax=uncultured Lutibacter sp. TaxID=437739 RepID=UPI0026309D42|nr:carboxypeptidase-like regulatory domain-containing protein [uncultured Lutibacter sp.]